MSGLLEFQINQTRFRIPSPSEDYGDNLLQFLRKKGFTGAKQVCGEGGCGACTVIVSQWDGHQIQHRSVTSCLVPLVTLQHCQVTTVEGLAALSRDGAHPVADAFYQLGASQCGFCTPGFLTNFVAHLENHPQTAKKELERIFDGNLCRCTGYRSILSAASVFCEDEFEDPGMTEKVKSWRQRWESCQRLNDLFPSEFCKTQPSGVLQNHEGQQWIQPESFDNVSAMTFDETCKVVSGNTDQGCLEKKQERYYQKKVYLNHLTELKTIEWLDEELRIGAGVTVEKLESELNSAIKSGDWPNSSQLKSLRDQCRFFANNQIRNMATVGGGLVNFSSYSDLIPIWVCMNTEALFVADGKEQRIPLSSMYEGNQWMNKQPSDFGLLKSLIIPKAEPDIVFSSYKYSRRRMDSITFLSAGVRMNLSSQNNILDDLVLCFDGLGRPGFRPKNTEKMLRGNCWDESLLDKALLQIKKDVLQSVANSLPRHLQEYQARLAQGILLRTFANYKEAIQQPLSSESSRLTARYPNKAHHGHSYFEETNLDVLGKAMPHKSSKHQTTGKACYTADVLVPNSLYAALVTSPVASGILKKMDATDALKSSEVIGFYSAADIPGKNKFGFRIEDEEVLATKEVGYVGQALGVVVATSDRAAKKAASQVKVQIEERQPVLSWETALKGKVCHGNTDGYRLLQGNPEKGFEKCHTVIEGEVEVGGQYPFYLEPQCANVIPSDDGFIVYSSTQSPSDVVDHVSDILGLSKNMVEVKVGRVGGGFGGKQLRAGPIAAICALAAHKSGRPVNLALTRAADMSYGPGRSPVMARYKAGFHSDGKVSAVDIEFYLNGGYTNDYSSDITECATLLMDSCYRLENVRVHGYCLKMNYGSYTATRGFGKPQSSAIIESIMDHGASVVGMDPVLMRRKNLYQKGDTTITNTTIKDDTLTRCWDRVVEKSDYSKLRTQVETFNSQNRWLKRGVSIVCSKGNMGFLESDDINRGIALLHIQRDGTVSVHHSGCEMGQGINTRLAQVTAHSLNLPLENVVIAETRSSIIPNTPPTTMVATDLIGRAIIKACDKLKSRLSKYKGNYWQQVEQAYFDGANLTESALHTEPRLSYDYEKQQGDISYFFVWGAALSVVELDIISGNFRILKTNIVQDCGKSLNPQIDIGQVEGGFLFGLGYYTMEEMIYSQKGKLITDNVSGYKIPSSGDIPLDWDIELLTGTPDNRGLHNSKGIGEANIQLGSSVYFAIKDAIRAARQDAGQSQEFLMDFPSSVERVCQNLPEIRTSPPRRL